MSEIETTLEQGVLQLRLNRPHKKNALSIQMYRDLTILLNDAKTNSDINVVLLKGHDNCFSSGNDLHDFLNAGELNDEHPTVQFLYTLASFNKPLVAAVSGLAIGIGTTLLLHCDLVYASENAKFQLPFTHLGLCPEAGSSLLLPYIAGYQKAAQYLLLGEPFDAHEAANMGFVNEVIAFTSSDNQHEKTINVEKHALNKALQLAALPSDALQTSKSLLKEAQQRLSKERIAKELKEFSRLLATDACQARILAFFKR